MFYEFSISVPANTAKASPTTQELHLTAGIVHYVEIEFPDGCAATDGSGLLTYLQIRQPEATYLPTNPEGWFASDGHIIPVKEHKELTESNNRLKLVAYNLDDTYAHIIRVRIGVLPKEELEPTSLLSDLLSRFLRLVGVR